MKIIKKVSVRGEWAKKGEDIKNGDVVKITSDIEIITGEYGEQHTCKVETRNGEKNVRLNQTSLNALVDSFGEETKEWVGKEVKITTAKQNVSGKFLDVYYFADPSYELGENGFFDPNKEEDDIDPDAIPF